MNEDILMNDLFTAFEFALRYITVVMSFCGLAFIGRLLFGRFHCDGCYFRMNDVPATYPHRRFCIRRYVMSATDDGEHLRVWKLR